MKVKPESFLLTLFRTIWLFSCCSFALLLFCSPASAQMPSDTARPVIKIAIDNGLLSVELSDAELGSVIKEIADKAKFKVEISSDAANKKISTVFKDLAVEKGLRRLFTIAKEKDYTISYDRTGAIDKLEVYGDGDKRLISPLQKNPQQTISRPVQQPASQPVSPPYQPISRPKGLPRAPVPTTPPAPVPVIPVTPPEDTNTN